MLGDAATVLDRAGDRIDWPRLVTVTHKYGMQPGVFYVLGQLRKLFGCRVPDEVLDELLARPVEHPVVPRLGGPAAQALPAQRPVRRGTAVTRPDRPRSPEEMAMTATAVDLAATARALVTPGKGILASDESDGTIAKRFASVGLASTPENRMRYRRMLYGTPGLGRFISGVILFDETLRQADCAGRPLVDLVLDAGIIPGIKVDRGTAPLPGFPVRP